MIDLKSIFSKSFCENLTSKTYSNILLLYIFNNISLIDGQNVKFSMEKKLDRNSASALQIFSSFWEKLSESVSACFFSLWVKNCSGLVILHLFFRNMPVDLKFQIAGLLLFTNNGLSPFLPRLCISSEYWDGSNSINKIIFFLSLILSHNPNVLPITDSKKFLILL